MHVSVTQQQRIALPGWLVPLIFAGSAGALAGGYWDDAWHTERGRDSFLIAPHIAIYAGVAASGSALALWAALAARAAGLRAALAHPSLALALMAVGATLASGPIDNAWHEAFGRDAVIWSPPHLLGIVGTAGLAAALLAELGGRRGQTAAAGLLVAALTFPVVEYETDVPQFDEAWYLPVLAAGALLALALARGALDRPFGAVRAAAAHLGLVAGAALLLVALGYDAPLLPLLVVPAALLDLAERRRLRPAATAALAVGGLYAAYVPWLELWGGVTLAASDVAIGLPVAFIAGWLALAAVAGASARVPAAASAAAASAAALALVLAAPAAAHDPGQGETAGALDLRATARAGTLTLDARAVRGCFEARSLAARRAGETIRAPLYRDGCRYRGSLRLPGEGRWFVYAELRDAGGTAVESWLPVTLEDGSGGAAERGRYAYVPPAEATPFTEVAAGAIMYLAMLALLATIVSLSARSRAR